MRKFNSTSCLKRCFASGTGILYFKPLISQSWHKRLENCPAKNGSEKKCSIPLNVPPLHLAAKQAEWLLAENQQFDTPSKEVFFLLYISKRFLGHDFWTFLQFYILVLKRFISVTHISAGRHWKWIAFKWKSDISLTHLIMAHTL